MNAARILSFEELETAKNPVYIEDYCGFGNRIMSELTKAVRYEWPDTDNEFEISFADAVYPRETYGHTWRAWSAKPTDSQRTETRPDCIRNDCELYLNEANDNTICVTF